jgi:hypothetical protein
LGGGYTWGELVASLEALLHLFTLQQNSKGIQSLEMGIKMCCDSIWVPVTGDGPCADSARDSIERLRAVAQLDGAQEMRFHFFSMELSRTPLGKPTGKAYLEGLLLRSVVGSCCLSQYHRRSLELAPLLPPMPLSAVPRPFSESCPQSAF